MLPYFDITSIIFWEFLGNCLMSPVDDFLPQPPRSDDRSQTSSRSPRLTYALANIEASLAHQFARQVKAGKQIEDIGMFGPEVMVVGGGKSKAGRPRLPIRLMVSLLYLKHAFNERGEGVVERWAETPSWQYFSRKLTGTVNRLKM
jgi:hypothetical protein